MTVEKDIGRLEAEVANIKEDHASFKLDMQVRLSKMEGQLQQILDAANMGKGAWWLLLKIGAALVTLITAGHWFWEKFSNMVVVK